MVFLDPLLLDGRSKKPQASSTSLAEEGLIVSTPSLFSAPLQRGWTKVGMWTEAHLIPPEYLLYYPLAYHRGGLSGFASKMTLGWVPRV